MCECLYRARERKIGHKNVASAPTLSISIGDFRWQTTALDLSSISLAARCQVLPLIGYRNYTPAGYIFGCFLGRVGSS